MTRCISGWLCMSSIALVTRYAAFAVVATLINLAAQWTCFHFYRGDGELILGMGFGTAMGLISKYVLDKYWIFNDRSRALSENLQKFGIYTFTGVFTTALFWGAEIAFAAISKAEIMRYIGAVIGLSVGYFAKYHLDNRFVFRARS